ncbi:UDP-N-acetylglucosamine--dolichyl-phosphate N-acetylglucosaminephosphotransferase [Diplonema papillatum]|nr:UDP-N-acetylglucosamine--dolichyl-phosphate N-acetylglucosaminephosphotransferase [Diplonema papillatum]
MSFIEFIDPVDMDDDGAAWPILVVTGIASIVAFFVTCRCVEQAKSVLRDRGIFGIDINKITSEGMDRFRHERKERPLNKFSDEFKKLLIPESLGIVVGGVYLATAIVLMVVIRLPLARYNAAICSIALMLLLGFVDDVLDVRWRHKIVLSMLATVPLMLSYDGSTTVLLPKPLCDYVAPNFDVGILYVVAMSLICVFCTNSINILAGVNGLEVGQSIVIGLSVLVHNLLQIQGANWRPHLISAVLCCPFIACSCGLFKYNRYDSHNEMAIVPRSSEIAAFIPPIAYVSCAPALSEV